MDNYLYITIVGLIAGISGTAAGALIIIIIKDIKNSILTFSLAFSSGIMTVIVFLDLIPESIDLGGVGCVLIGMLLGIILIAFLDNILPHEHYLQHHEGDYLRAGLLLAVGIALHNLPEGLAIGAGYSADSSLGMNLALIIGIHNAPEGMAVATSLLFAGVKNVKILLITIAAGIPMGVGTLIGAYLGNVSTFFLSIALGFAAGAMLFITFDELIPSAHDKSEGNLAIIGILIGVFAGICITNYI